MPFIFLIFEIAVQQDYILLFYRIILTIGLIVAVNTGFSHDTTADSLLNIVQQNRATAKTYNELALEYWIIDINQSREFALKALKLAWEEQDWAQVAFAFNRLGTAYLYLGKLDSAQINYNKSADIFEKLKMYTELGGATACCAKIFESKLKYDSAIQEYTKALKIFEKSEKSEYYVQTLIVVGSLYSKLGDFQNAQKYFDIALENKSYLKDYDLIIMYNKIGTNYQEVGDLNNAIKFFEEAFKKCDLSNNDLALATTYVNTGKLYIAWDKKDAALKYLEKGFELSKSTGVEQYCKTILPLIADIYLSFGQLDKAKDYYSRLLDYTAESKDIFNEASAYNGLSKVCTEKYQYQEAIKYSLKALGLFKKFKNPLYIANSHYLLAKNYIGASNLKKAKEHLDAAAFIAEKNSLKELEARITLLYARYNNIANKGLESNKFYEKYIAIKDSIFAGQNQKLLAKFQVELDNLEKDYKLKEAKNLNKLKEAELSQKKRQIVNISILSLLLLLGVFVFAVMSIKQKKANRLLFLKNKELIEQGKKPQKQGEETEISESLQNDIIQRLNKELNENSIHLKNDLTLHSLSKILGTNSSYLSKIIKTTYNSGFSTYLNKLRIIEAQKMILDKNFDNYTIDAISRECGYNSKSTFNKAFKGFTGLTPKEYKRQGTLSITDQK